MCIINDPEMLKKERAKTGRLMLWKVVWRDNTIGLWGDTKTTGIFHVGVNKAKRFSTRTTSGPGQFHCFLSRRTVRKYKKYHGSRTWTSNTKVIKIYVSRKNIVKAGIDENSRRPCISVSKLTIKSLKHQR